MPKRQQKKSPNNPRSFVEALRQVVQDLLVPELKAIQVTLQHHGELIQALQRQMDERFAKVDERFAKVDERFAKVDERFERLEASLDERFKEVWQAIHQLTEAQQHTQVMLQRILDRLDFTDALRETRSRQDVMETQIAHLQEQMQHLRSLMEMVLRQRGIEPPPPP